MSKRITDIGIAVGMLEGVTGVRHVMSVPLREMFGKTPVWEGVVEVFEIDGHPKAKRCYAWSYPDGKGAGVTTVLEIPPVDSPQTAVRAAIVSQGKN